MITLSSSKKLIYFCFLSLFLFSALTPQASFGQVVPDNTRTIVENMGNNSYKVTTSSTNGKFALNSYSQFDIHAGEKYNLILPDNVNVMINRVNSPTGTNINGMMNLRTSENGPIGGTLIHLNRQGNIIIGPDGAVNVGGAIFSNVTSAVVKTVNDTNLDLVTMSHDMFENPDNILPNEIESNDVIRSPITGTLTASSGTSIINNGRITANLSYGDGIDLFASQIKNNGELSIKNIDNDGNPGNSPKDGSGNVNTLFRNSRINLISGGELYYHAYDSLLPTGVRPTKPASGVVPGEPGVINEANAIIYNKSGTISLVSYVDPSEGALNSVVNNGIIDVSTANNLPIGPESSIIVGGVYLTSRGEQEGPIVNNGIINASGRDGGFVEVTGSDFQASPSSSINVSDAAPRHEITLVSHYILFRTNTDQDMQFGVDSGNGNFVVDNQELATMTLNEAPEPLPFRGIVAYPKYHQDNGYTQDIIFHNVNGPLYTNFAVTGHRVIFKGNNTFNGLVTVTDFSGLSSTDTPELNTPPQELVVQGNVTVNSSISNSDGFAFLTSGNPVNNPSPDDNMGLESTPDVLNGVNGMFTGEPNTTLSRINTDATPVNFDNLNHDNNDQDVLVNTDALNQNE